LKCNYKRSRTNGIETFASWDPNGKYRWNVLGLDEPALLALVYPIRGNDSEVIRLISARKVDARERVQYRKA
jgi:uncharacterized DUF497 family protein